MDAGNSFVLPYGKMLTVGDDGQPAETVERIEIDGLSIQANTSKGVNRVVVFVENLNELIILSPKTYRSTFRQAVHS